MMRQYKRPIADIDKPGIRVIVNPGGSNGRFAQADFKTPRSRSTTHNVTIFGDKRFE